MGADGGCNMDVARPDFLPDPSLDRAGMIAQQREIATAASFQSDDRLVDADPADLTVAGVDQAFTDEHVVSAAVVLQDGAVVDEAIAREPQAFPYIPGLLAFREAGAVVSACTALEVEPDVLLVDGNGRLHYRQAGLATHVGVALDAVTVGVAKRQLCGYLCDPPASPFSAGTRVPIVAGSEVDADPGSRLGFAVQSRQWDRPESIRPIYASPGHRVGPAAAADIALGTCTGYKLPEPIRAADRAASRASSDR